MAKKYKKKSLTNELFMEAKIQDKDKEKESHYSKINDGNSWYLDNEFMKELSFTKAFCVGYDEQFTSTNEIPMRITMELVAKELTFGDAKFSNNWIALD